MKKILLTFLGVLCFAQLVYAAGTTTYHYTKLKQIDLVHPENNPWVKDIDFNVTFTNNGSNNLEELRKYIDTNSDGSGEGTNGKRYVDGGAFEYYYGWGQLDEANGVLIANHMAHSGHGSWNYGQRFIDRASCRKWVSDNSMNPDYALCDDIINSCTEWDGGAMQTGVSCNNYKKTSCADTNDRCNYYRSRFLICKAPYRFDGLVDNNGNRVLLKEQASNDGYATFNCVLNFKAKFKDDYGWLENHPGSLLFDTVTQKSLSAEAADISTYAEAVTCTSNEDYSNPTIVCAANKGYFWDMPRCEDYRKAHMEEDGNYKKECVYLCPDNDYSCIIKYGAPYALQETKNSRSGNCASGLTAIGSVGCKK